MRVIQPGDGTPEGDGLARALERERERGALYGAYDFVMGAVAIAEICRVLDPVTLGLQPVSDRRFAAPHGDFVRLLEVAAFKGASYAIQWGVSLPYVPLALKRPPRYARTLKSARMSLWLGNDRAPAEPGHERARFIGTFHGARRPQ